jgi:hypothetical protein
MAGVCDPGPSEVATDSTTLIPGLWPTAERLPYTGTTAFSRSILIQPPDDGSPREATMGNMTTGSARGDLEMMLLMCVIYGVLAGSLGTYLGLLPWWSVTKKRYLRMLVLGIPLAAVGTAVGAIVFHVNGLMTAVITAYAYGSLRGWLATSKI